jgi:hypothetical protein
MLNPQQFGPQKPNTYKSPIQSSSGGRGRFLPPIKTREELDLIEAKAKALNAKTARSQGIW